MQSDSTVAQTDHIGITNVKEAIDKLYSIHEIELEAFIGISIQMKDSTKITIETRILISHLSTSHLL